MFVLDAMDDNRLLNRRFYLDLFHARLSPRGLQRLKNGIYDDLDEIPDAEDADDEVRCATFRSSFRTRSLILCLCFQDDHPMAVRTSLLAYSCIKRLVDTHQPPVHSRRNLRRKARSQWQAARKARPARLSESSEYLFTPRSIPLPTRVR